MSNLTETPQHDPGPDREARLHDQALALEADKLAAWQEQEREQEREEDLRYRYCDDPFCSCTPDRMLRFLKLVGVLDGWGDLSSYGETLKHLWNTDPGADREAGSGLEWLGRGLTGRPSAEPK